MRKLFRSIIIIVNIVVAVSLLLAYLCCFVSPETIWWLSFFGLGYIYLLAANLCFVVFWALTKNKRYALFSLVIILLGWNMIWRNVQVMGKKLPESKLDDSFKVVTYNVHLFHQANSKQPDGTKLNIFDFIKKSGADILCMQEFTSVQKGEMSPTNMSKWMGIPHYHIEHTTGNIGISTYSRYPIINKQLIYSDNTTNSCMYSDIVKGQDTIRVYNVHLKSIGFSKEERSLLDNAIKKEYDDKDVNVLKAIVRQMTNASFRRSWQVDIVAESISKSPYPVIICGDFNDPPTSYSYQTIRSKRKDAFKESGKGRSTTYNIGRISSQRIDYIMYSPVYRAYDYESPRVNLSDHYPVMCRFVKR